MVRFQAQLAAKNQENQLSGAENQQGSFGRAVDQIVRRVCQSRYTKKILLGFLMASPFITSVGTAPVAMAAPAGFYEAATVEHVNEMRRTLGVMSHRDGVKHVAFVPVSSNPLGDQAASNLFEMKFANGSSIKASVSPTNFVILFACDGEVASFSGNQYDPKGMGQPQNVSVHKNGQDCQINLRDRSLLTKTFKEIYDKTSRYYNYAQAMTAMENDQVAQANGQTVWLPRENIAPAKVGLCIDWQDQQMGYASLVAGEDVASLNWMKNGDGTTKCRQSMMMSGSLYVFDYNQNDFGNLQKVVEKEFTALGCTNAEVKRQALMMTYGLRTSMMAAINKTTGARQDQIGNMWYDVFKPATNAL